MKKNIRKWANEIFIDGLSGMAMGLFATLIIGTIMKQLGTFLDATVLGKYLIWFGSVACAVTGAGIGIGVATKLKQGALVTVSSAVAGMTGAFAAKILAEQSAINGSVFTLAGPGEPLGAFVAAIVAVEFGRLVAGKTQIDILVTPLVTIISGSAIGLLIGPPISKFMNELGKLINWGTEQQPLLMGIVVSVLMGMILTLPISSAALGVALSLSGLAAGAATVGCCANMIGFAVASYRENKMGGLVAQGLGTSMLQVPNIVKKPVIWLPAIISSAVLGPISTTLLKMTGNAVGSGMGSAGLVGPIMSFQTMTEAGISAGIVLAEILLMYFVAPAVLSLGISEFMRKKKWIKQGDMKLDLK